MAAATLASNINSTHDKQNTRGEALYGKCNSDLPNRAITYIRSPTHLPVTRGGHRTSVLLLQKKKNQSCAVRKWAFNSSVSHQRAKDEKEGNRAEQRTFATLGLDQAMQAYYSLLQE